MRKIKLIIVEDHQSMIDGIRLLLKHEEEIEVLEYFNNGTSLIEFLQENHKTSIPDIILTDIKMSKMNGVELTKIITIKYPEIKVVAFSMLSKESVVLQMLHAGVSGYLLKNSSLELILKAVKEVSEGKTFFDLSLQEIITKHEENPKKEEIDGIESLTKSERKILKLIGEGKISSEIAGIRFTAVSTVEKHRKNMIRKLGLTGKNDLLKYAVEKKFDELS